MDDDQTAASTFDIHVAYDSSTFGLADARTHKKSRDERQLWGGPYVVGTDSPKYRTSAQLNDLCQSVVSMGRSRQVQAIARALSISDAETQRVLANAKATGENQHCGTRPVRRRRRKTPSPIFDSAAHE